MINYYFLFLRMEIKPLDFSKNMIGTDFTGLKGY